MLYIHFEQELRDGTVLTPVLVLGRGEEGDACRKQKKQSNEHFKVSVHNNNTTQLAGRNNCRGEVRPIRYYVIASFPGPHAKRGSGSGDTWQNSRMC